MNKPKIKTIGELKSSDYTYKSLNQEITDNLRHNLSEGKNVFSNLSRTLHLKKGWGFSPLYAWKS